MYSNNHIDQSWSFLHGLTPDALWLLASSLSIRFDSSFEAIVGAIITKSYSNEKNLSYERSLSNILQHHLGVSILERETEFLEDSILAFIISKGIFRCTEDQKDELFSILGLPEGLKKNDIFSELKFQSSRMDKLLLPAVAFLLIDGPTEKRDFIKRPFHISPDQISILNTVHYNAKLSIDACCLVTVIAFRRWSLYVNKDKTVDAFKIQVGPVCEKATHSDKEIIKSIGRKRESWLNDSYASRVALEAIESKLKSANVWGFINSELRLISFPVTKRTDSNPVKALSAATLYYILQQNGIAKANKSKSIPISFERTVAFLNTGKLDLAGDAIEEKLPSRATISKYWNCLSLFYEKLSTIHKNGRFKDNTDLKQQARLLGFEKNVSGVFFDEHNIVILDKCIESVNERLSKHVR